jgi:hypothetical protein
LIVSVAFDLTVLNFVAMVVIALLAYVLLIKYRKRKIARDVALVRSQILAFFGAAGMQVEVSCYTADNTRKLTVCIDSQPVRKFKFSNLVEMVLIRYLSRTTSVPVERIYWRFSMPTENTGEMPTPSESPIESMATEGAELKDDFEDEMSMADAYKVAETSWDQFERALILEEAEKELKNGVKKEAEAMA